LITTLGAVTKLNVLSKPTANKLLAEAPEKEILVVLLSINKFTELAVAPDNRNKPSSGRMDICLAIGYNCF
jgi:hypothetical protein